MPNQTTPDFIIIDDDPINNMICRKYIGIIFPSADVKTFTDPLSGLRYIQSKYEDTATNKVCLFLDINMPVLNGWEVLDKFVELPGIVRDWFTIYMLSSSIAIKDKEMAADHPHVEGYIEKPLTLARLNTIFPNSN